MIKIEITDLNNLGYNELSNLIEYLKSTLVSISPSEVSIIPRDLPDSKLNENKYEIDCSIEGDGDNIKSSDSERWEGDPSFNPFAKCSAIPNTEIPYISLNIIPGTVIPIIPKVPLFNPEIKANIEVELDSKGMPWNEKIHAKTKSKNKNGEWKGLRGSANKINESKPNQEVSNPIPKAALTPDLRISSEESKPNQEIPYSPIISPSLEEPTNNFATLMTLITSSIANNTLEKYEVTKIINDFGLPTIPVVATRPDLIPAIIQALKECISESV
jgi:hypothetical protein